MRRDHCGRVRTGDGAGRGFSTSVREETRSKSAPERVRSARGPTNYSWPVNASC
jgi:hypothetical protein